MLKPSDILFAPVSIVRAIPFLSLRIFPVFVLPGSGKDKMRLLE